MVGTELDDVAGTTGTDQSAAPAKGAAGTFGGTVGSWPPPSEQTRTLDVRLVDAVTERSERDRDDAAQADAARDARLLVELKRVEGHLSWLRVASGVLVVLMLVSRLDAGAPALVPGVVLASTLVGLSAVTWLIVRLAERRHIPVRVLQAIGPVGFLIHLTITVVLALINVLDAAIPTFVLLWVAPVEGAVRWRMRGALAGWALASLLYVAMRVSFADDFGLPQAHAMTMLFRVGHIGLIAVVVGKAYTQLWERYEEADRANERLRQTDEWRAKLVRMLAHDAKQPLCVINQSLVLFEAAAEDDDGVAYNDDQQAALDAIRQQVAEMSDLTGSLLDFARLEDGQVVPACEVIRVTDELAAVLGACAQLLIGVEVEIHGSDDVLAWADRAHVRRMFTNLVTNAVRYGRGPIVIDMISDGADTLVCVRDHGPGVSDEARATLFDQFATTSTLPGSTGIGLWSVRQLARLNGGNITYQDASPGACFEMCLPAGDHSGGVQSVPAGEPVPATAGPT